MFRYIIVATNGRSWPVFASQAEFEAANLEDVEERPVFVLPNLLQQGWRPVRETSIGDKFALVLLEQEPRRDNGAVRGGRHPPLR
jgi:hypothetical protein